MWPRCKSLSRTALRPRQDAGRLGRLHGDAADANDAGIEEAVDAGERCDCVEDAGDSGARIAAEFASWKNAQRKPGQPNQGRRPEKEVEKAKPDGGDPVDEPDGGVGKAEGEQRGDDEAESQNQHRDAQIGGRGGAETGPEGDAGGVDEPMGKKEEDLDD